MYYPAGKPPYNNKSIDIVCTPDAGFSAWKAAKNAWQLGYAPLDFIAMK